jgi:hypothetical protein
VYSIVQLFHHIWSYLEPLLPLITVLVQYWLTRRAQGNQSRSLTKATKEEMAHAPHPYQ